MRQIKELMHTIERMKVPKAPRRTVSRKPTPLIHRNKKWHQRKYSFEMRQWIVRFYFGHEDYGK